MKIEEVCFLATARMSTESFRRQVKERGKYFAVCLFFSMVSSETQEELIRELTLTDWVMISEESRLRQIDNGGEFSRHVMDACEKICNFATNNDWR